MLEVKLDKGRETEIGEGERGFGRGVENYGQLKGVREIERERERDRERKRQRQTAPKISYVN